MKQLVPIEDTIASVEEAYAELRKTAKIVLHDVHSVSARANEYRGKYCYPFYETGDYYAEYNKNPEFDRYGRLTQSGSHCFMPLPLDEDMCRFVESLRKLDQAIRPLFGWNIRKDWPHDDRGNIQVDEAKGYCYIGHTGRKIHANSHRKHYVLVGVICYGVYKDAFLDEILDVVRTTGVPITKKEFRKIEGFSR